MSPYTGKYTEHIRDNHWKSIYYTFTPRPLKSSNYFKMDDELAALLSASNKLFDIVTAI